MSDKTQRHLQLLALTAPLHHYAGALEADHNAAFLLVHRALARAFAEPAHAMRAAGGLEASLRADIHRDAQSWAVCA